MTARGCNWHTEASLWSTFHSARTDRDASVADPLPAFRVTPQTCALVRSAAEAREVISGRSQPRCRHDQHTRENAAVSTPLVLA